MNFVVMRRPCLPEDEGRHFLEKVYTNIEEARAWIASQKGEYFGPGAYYILKEHSDEA